MLLAAYAHPSRTILTHSFSGYIVSISKQFNDALKTFHDFISNRKNL